MNNFAAMNLCGQCTLQHADDAVCSACKLQWNNETLPAQFSPQGPEIQYLKEIAQSLRQQRSRQKGRWVVSALALMIGLAAVLILFNTANSIVNTFSVLAAETSGLVATTSRLAENISQIDLQDLADTSKTVLEQTNASMRVVSDQLTAIDIAALNKSIQDLAVIVSPLARLLGG